MILTLFHFISVILFCFISNQYVLDLVFLSFLLILCSLFVLCLTFLDFLSYYLFYSFPSLLVYKLYKCSTKDKLYFPHSLSFSLRHKVLVVYQFRPAFCCILPLFYCCAAQWSSLTSFCQI